MDIFTNSKQTRLYIPSPHPTTTTPVWHLPVWEPLFHSFKQYMTFNLHHKCSCSAPGYSIHQIHLLLLFTEASSQKVGYRSNLNHLKNISDGFFSPE